jgi:hypothetical protein
MNTKFKIGDIVFLKTDSEQLPRIVTGILLRNECYIYYLSNTITETTHYDFEISIEVNELVKMFN